MSAFDYDILGLQVQLLGGQLAIREVRCSRWALDQFDAWPEGGSRSFRHLMLGPSRSFKKWRKLQDVAEARSSRRERERKREFSQNVQK